jgi:hypothetical protein
MTAGVLPSGALVFLTLLLAINPTPVKSTSSDLIKCMTLAADYWAKKCNKDGEFDPGHGYLILMLEISWIPILPLDRGGFILHQCYF